jgi:hypothetical protein
MTGVSLRSGNFMAIPESMVKNVLTYPGIENHIAASISRYSPSLLFRQFNRGKRIAGKSRMNFSGLILHAYGAFTIYADIILAKFFLGLIFTALGLSLVGGLVIILRILNLIQVIPGWTSIFVGQIIATVITLLATSVTGLMLLLRVNSNTGKGFLGSTKSLH